MSGKTPSGFTDAFFQNELKAYLPEMILDFHTHVWKPEHWINYGGNTPVADNTVFASKEIKEHQKYMSTTVAYSAEAQRPNSGGKITASAVVTKQKGTHFLGRCVPFISACEIL